MFLFSVLDVLGGFLSEFVYWCDDLSVFTRFPLYFFCFHSERSRREQKKDAVSIVNRFNKSNEIFKSDELIISKSR
jgi:hypothetical protein